ncbi:putative sh3 domain protein [Daldinia childiae]|uniref:putative sh3 domain protein n=1 Tax=Daldinia childiae TaxID=326645 RepID=UPI0014472676|nr:putative sh3 domain protein [Daldinia childiae]KAF3059862.1 putative sh3 domain protein [Daldinia childiae]
MTRPQMIRADTPSAKKHKSPSSNAAPNGSLAPHQAETLREVEDDRAGEEARSPRISWTDGDSSSDLQQYAEQLANSLNGNKMQSEDALAIAQNGGVLGNGSDDGDMDADADDGLDDDMMDKISSSPSIEDGGYTLPPPAWPRRVDSLRPLALHSVSLNFPAPSEMRLPSPCLESVEHPSIHPPDQQASKASAYKSNHHHHPFPGEYNGSTDRANHTEDPDDLSLPESESSM